MRLFVALDTDDPGYFSSLQKQLPTSAVYRLPAHFHLTLFFIGDVVDTKVKEIVESLGKVAFKGFSLKTNAIGFFPSEDYVRVVWVGFEENKEVMELQERIGSVMKKFGFSEKEQYVPHITLARVKHVEDKKDLLEKLKMVKTEPKAFSFSNFKLYKSVLTKQGPEYGVVEAFS